MFAVNMYIAAKSPMRFNLKYESIFPRFFVHSYTIPSNSLSIFI